MSLLDSTKSSRSSGLGPQEQGHEKYPFITTQLYTEQTSLPLSPSLSLYSSTQKSINNPLPP